uniref:G-protein coupled receptors family 1 profile domain-containing protein n=1 Tax=Oncorhynchus tshawytscha TaxID=74940 RepID=A0AAZ3QBD6_ONCTS
MQVVRSAQCITGGKLPALQDTYTTRCHRKTIKVIKGNNHPSHNHPSHCLHTPTNLLILSLAVSDLLVGLIVIPVVTVAIMESCWGFGEYFWACNFYISFECTSLLLSNLVLISINLYVAVCDPLLYHSKITIRGTICCISITLCCCIIYDAVIIKDVVNAQTPSRCLKECFIVEGKTWVNIIYI